MSLFLYLVHSLFVSKRITVCTARSLILPHITVACSPFAHPTFVVGRSVRADAHLAEVALALRLLQPRERTLQHRAGCRVIQFLVSCGLVARSNFRILAATNSPRATNCCTRHLQQLQ